MELIRPLIALLLNRRGRNRGDGAMQRVSIGNDDNRPDLPQLGQLRISRQPTPINLPDTRRGFDLGQDARRRLVILLGHPAKQATRGNKSTGRCDARITCPSQNPSIFGLSNETRGVEFVSPAPHDLNRQAFGPGSCSGARIHIVAAVSYNGPALLGKGCRAGPCRSARRVVRRHVCRRLSRRMPGIMAGGPGGNRGAETRSGRRLKPRCA